MLRTKSDDVTRACVCTTVLHSSDAVGRVREWTKAC